MSEFGITPKGRNAVTRWLSEGQQRDWRAFLSVLNILPLQFSKVLQENFGLSLSDYEILVRLSESEDRALRMSELAAATLASRSRLSHQVDRLERAGYVSRRACLDDRRGAWAEMTDAGWELLVKAAPLHVESVREHLVDVLTDEEFQILGKISNKVLDQVTPEFKNKIIGFPENTK